MKLSLGLGLASMVARAAGAQGAYPLSPGDAFLIATNAAGVERISFATNSTSAERRIVVTK